MEAIPRAPATLSSPSPSIGLFPHNPSPRSFIPTFSPLLISNSEFQYAPTSSSSSMETLAAELPCPCLDFLQTAMALRLADSPANPCTYTAPPAPAVTNQTELSDRGNCGNYLPSSRRIKDSSSRQVAFCKRRTALFKKAHELSILCDAEIAILIFSPSGKLSEFSTSSMSHIIKRYQSFQPQMPSNNHILQDVEIWKNEAILLKKRLNCLQDFQRCVFEKNITPASINEIQSVEPMIENALYKIRKRKEEILYEENKVLKEKLIQIKKMRNIVSNTSSGWEKLPYHQDSVNTKLQLGLDILHCTPMEEN